MREQTMPLRYSASSVIREARRFARKYRRGDRPTDEGQALIEFALMLPLLLFFTFVLIEICLAYYSYCMISECAREGTRFAMVRGATCQFPSGASCTATPAQIQTFVSQIGYPNLGGGVMTPVATFPGATGSNPGDKPGSPVQVTVTYTLPVNLPFIPMNAISMSSTSVMNFVQ